MPGGRWRTFRHGDRSQLLVQYLLSALAFTTPVPREEDIGYDFFCSLILKQEKLLKAGPFFSVQAKSSSDPIVYEKDHELEWITGQENPLLICVADRDAVAMDIYSTWNLPCGPLYRKPTRITLLPGVARDGWPGVEYEDEAKGMQKIRLGAPIGRVTDSDISSDARLDKIARVIGEWVELDRANIVSRRAGMYWVVGPLEYTTNELPFASGGAGVSYYWNLANLRQSCENLGRIVALLSLVLRDGLQAADRNTEPWADRLSVLQKVVRAYWDVFDEAVRQSLKSQGFEPKE